MPTSLLVSDLDGTLLTSEKSVTPRTTQGAQPLRVRRWAVLDRHRADGVRLRSAPCTGRPAAARRGDERRSALLIRQPHLHPGAVAARCRGRGSRRGGRPGRGPAPSSTRWTPARCCSGTAVRPTSNGPSTTVSERSRRSRHCPFWAPTTGIASARRSTSRWSAPSRSSRRWPRRWPALRDCPPTRTATSTPTPTAWSSPARLPGRRRPVGRLQRLVGADRLVGLRRQPQRPRHDGDGGPQPGPTGEHARGDRHRRRGDREQRTRTGWLERSSSTGPTGSPAFPRSS